ncbi:MULTISPECIES: hypothetical protein [unclassified Hydrogenobaculum]|uniref:hypothetical protein n=1 Tax=unclassified Hydrogenobaculum TaxID=2622382 RepID=UPI00030E861A|nr:MULTISPECIES: hypothetical protein [unclassified Hydrogenobaculum]
MKKKIFLLGIFAFIMIGCSSKQQTKENTSAQNTSQAPPPSISCKDYCKQECQGLAKSCETNCLNACYPTP